MHYEHIVPAAFLERPNRFIAYARYQGAVVTCHVKNTGRCKELLLPGADIFPPAPPGCRRHWQKDGVFPDQCLQGHGPGQAADQPGLPGPQPGGMGMDGKGPVGPESLPGGPVRPVPV